MIYLSIQFFIKKKTEMEYNILSSILKHCIARLDYSDYVQFKKCSRESIIYFCF